MLRRRNFFGFLLAPAVLPLVKALEWLKPKPRLADLINDKTFWESPSRWDDTPGAREWTEYSTWVDQRDGKTYTLTCPTDAEMTWTSI